MQVNAPARQKDSGNKEKQRNTEKRSKKRIRKGNLDLALSQWLTYSIPSCSQCLLVTRQYPSNKATKQKDAHSKFGSLTKKL